MDDQTGLLLRLSNSDAIMMGLAESLSNSVEKVHPSDQYFLKIAGLQPGSRMIRKADKTAVPDCM